MPFSFYWQIQEKYKVAEMHLLFAIWWCGRASLFLLKNTCWQILTELLSIKKQNKTKHENNTDISIVNCNLLQLNTCYHGKQKIADKRFVTSKEVNLSSFSGIQFWWRLAIYDCQKQGKNFHFSYNFRLALSEAMISQKKCKNQGLKQIR